MKQIIIMRGDLNMSRGKIAAQACHGSLGSFKRADSNKIRKWELEGEKKVVVKVNDLQELFEIRELVKKADIASYLVRDAGHTEIPSSTVTCLGIGPDDDEKIDKITQDLKLLK
ncbi:aminoacyl-tRNA hydrolase [Methanobacterium alcaliphilum]|uniref:aminoacyl-tRNA hydrolase n=1 Tax=Methanobacterium alcaliphilum TaxID=392018 RepID=UPI002009F44F|nr:aminoacyl-tRNA hydrolase [Methanobacterium alcaliphilum]MCK9152191.1 aminoacyl-tRNA hydrolase [Methanobacterium alcaliphilum]